MDELNYLILNYDIPFHITEDVSRRVTDWIATSEIYKKIFRSDKSNTRR